MGNGLTACLISDTSELKITNNILAQDDSSDSEPDLSDEETGSEGISSDPEADESDNEDEALNEILDEEEEARSNARLHGTHEAEEKLVENLF